MQGFWLLEPVPVDDIDRLEAYNIVLEQTLGADRCHNIDRIMRLPGTINLPNRKKRLAGREPALARRTGTVDTGLRTSNRRPLRTRPMKTPGRQTDTTLRRRRARLTLTRCRCPRGSGT